MFLKKILCMIIAVFLLTGVFTLTASAASYNAYDVAKIHDFLIQTDDEGTSNATKLGYDPGNPVSWTGITWVVLTPDDRMQTISFPSVGLTGNLDLSGCTYLQSVNCGNTLISGINLSNCTALQELICAENPSLTALNIDGCTNLTDVEAINCGLTSFFLEHAINSVDLRGNPLNSLAVGAGTPYEVFKNMGAGKFGFYWQNGTDPKVYAVPNPPAQYMGLSYGGLIISSSAVAEFNLSFPGFYVATFGYNVTFNSRGGSAVPGALVADDEHITKPADPVKDYYTFGGWYTGTDFLRQWNFTSDKVTGHPVTLYAKWTADSYAITYNLNGGAATNPETYTAESDFTLNNPTKPNYDFAGWSGTGISGTSMSVAVPAGSFGARAYTANWTPSAYAITYNLDGGTAFNPATYTIESAAFTLGNPAKTGYDFTGWSGTGITGTSMSVTIPSGSTGERTYTANWTPLVYTITCNLNGGAAFNPATYTIESAAFTLGNPTKTGYVFTGWSGTGISGTSLSVTIPAGSFGSRTYTANWTPSVYAVTYNLDGGAASNPSTYTIESAAFTLVNPTKYGCDFAGWTGTGISGTSLSVTVPSGSTGDRAYSAVWTSQTPSICLRGVSLSCGGLTKPFVKTVMNQKISIGELDGSITFTPLKEYDGAVMTINKQNVPSLTLPVANGKSVKFIVKLTCAGKSKTYTFTATRAKSTNNNLLWLNRGLGTLDSPFDPNDTSYVLTLSELTQKTKITAAAAPLASLSPKNMTVALNNGASKVVKFTVKSQAGQKKTYTITVVRAKSTDNTLKSLKVSGASLSPAYSAGVTSYTAVMSASASSCTVTVVPKGYKAKVFIDGMGKPSKKITLLHGQSAWVTVTVTAQSGDVREYRIFITRP